MTEVVGFGEVTCSNSRRAHRPCAVEGATTRAGKESGDMAAYCVGAGSVAGGAGEGCAGICCNCIPWNTG